jgi:hypothetical protein
VYLPIVLPSSFLQGRERGEVLRPEVSRLVGSPPTCSSVEALPESILLRWSLPGFGLVECGSSTRIQPIPTESRLLSPFVVSGFQLVQIPAALPQSE